MLKPFSISLYKLVVSANEILDFLKNKDNEEHYYKDKDKQEKYLENNQDIYNKLSYGNIDRYCDTIGHVHIADVPGRHEPGTGEINYARVLRQLKDSGYQGIVGCELFPETDTKTAVKAIMALKAAL